MNRVLPVLTVLCGIIAIWYAAAVWMNSTWVFDQAERAGTPVTWGEVIPQTMAQERPLLPPPHQVAGELWKGFTGQAVTSKRSLVYHGFVTLKGTLMGFALGIIFGVGLAMAIVRFRVMEMSVMPWAIISQTIPIVALAPMILVVASQVGIEGRDIPKAIIAAYLSFFPVLVSMVKGLRSPDQMQLDLLKTYGASEWQTFVKLRIPASTPYFFASLKVAIAASLIGTIVGELPTGAIEGLGARMLIGSQFGEPLIMWSALFAAAILAGLLIVAVGFVERFARSRMGGAGMTWIAGTLAVWLAAWALNARVAASDWARTRAGRLFVPVLFGVTVLVVWEGLVRGLNVAPVILPAPSAIAATIATSLPTLWADFVQTVLKGAIPGFLIGSGAAVATAIAIDRSPFLQRGLLPIGNFVAALPIVGLAPILVMWFGFDWQSKAAVVVVMVFFPVLVNMVAGLQASERMQRDLTATWGASYWQTMMKLRLPAAMPFLFNGLKIASTLALIGAIVAEFFGSPIYGMGFRISTEVGRLGLDMVWATIAVAALAGSALYGLISLIERGVTFWHPSQRH